MAFTPATCLKTFIVVVTGLCFTKTSEYKPISDNKMTANCFKGKKGLFRLMQRAVSYRNSSVVMHK